LLGGVLTQTINWHWIFFVNLPIGVATALFAIRLVPDREGIGLTAGADLPGAALLTGGLVLGVYTILGVAEKGWGSTQTLALGAVSVGLLGAFVARQARIANPLMPLRLFRSRTVSGANAVQALLVVGMFGMFFLGALYMQRVLGYGEPLAPALNSGYHLAYLSGAGLVLVAIGIAVSVLRARLPEAASAPVPEVPAEPVPSAGTEKRAPAFRVEPLPAYAAAAGA